MKLAILAALALSMQVTAQEHSGATMFKVSVVALAASTTFDFATSIVDAHGCGRVSCYETNSLLTGSSGRFSTTRAIASKSLLNGSLVLAEMILVKKYPRLRKPFSIVNFGDAGIYTYTGVHNLGIRR